MRFRVRLTKSQYRFFASSFRTISEGITLASSAAYFLPETLQIKQPISFIRYLLFLAVGLIFIIIGAILEKEGEERHD